MPVDTIDQALAILDAFGKRAVERVAEHAAPKLAALVEQQFDAGVDPDGAPWADLADSTTARGRFPPPLTDTGEMRGGLEATASGSTITLSLDEPADFHQTGTSRMPARPIFPGDGDLPLAYEDALVAAVYEVEAEIGKAS